MNKNKIFLEYYKNNNIENHSKVFNNEINKILNNEYPRGKQITVCENPTNEWIKVGLQNAGTVSGKATINVISSIYGKDKNFILREIHKGNLLYQRK